MYQRPTCLHTEESQEKKPKTGSRDLSAEALVQSRASPALAASVSVSYMSSARVDLGGAWFTSCPPLPLALTLFSPLFRGVP